MQRLLDRAVADRTAALSLSVEPDNAAMRLYLALGFERVGESGGSVTLLRTLTPGALRAVEDALRAVVAHDDERLRVVAPAAGDLFEWTRDYGTYGNVKLVLPPGSPAQWSIDTTDVFDGRKHLAVEMWTKQEGRSDLTLELHLREVAPGEWEPRILDLHVL